MTYSTGQIITTAEYNTFATGNASGTGNHNVANVNTIYGTGTGDKGYGQSGTLSPVSVGAIISATQWATLLNTISTIANHQGTTIASIANPSAGDVVTAYSSLQANIDAIFANRRNAAASGTDITAGGTSTQTTGWVNASKSDFTVTWPSADAMRYFFNAGGMILISASLSGGSGTAKDLDWTDTLIKMGTIAFTGGAGPATIAGTTYTGTNKIGGSGTPATLLTDFGMFDITAWDSTTFTEIFKQFPDTSSYTTNYAAVHVQGQTGGAAIKFRVELVDAEADTVNDTVDGTLTKTLVVRPPSTTYLTNSWGTPTISLTEVAHS